MSVILLRQSLEGLFNVKNYGATGDGVTDDSDSINAAVTAAVANGGGIVFFPIGSYNLDGDLHTRDDGTNALIPFPNTEDFISIKFLGEVPPTNYWDTISSPQTIITANTTASGDYPAIFGGYGGVFDGLTNFYPIFENLVIRQPNDTVPTLRAVDMHKCTSGRVCNCIIDTNGGTLITPAPTDNNAIGIMMPDNGNNGLCTVENSAVYGYHTGVLIGEHSVLRNFGVQSCWNGLSVNDMGHSAYADYLNFGWCKNYIVFGGSDKAYILINSLDIEESPESYWDEMEYHIDDEDSKLYGTINQVHRCISGTGAVTGELTKNGGTNLVINQII